MKLLSSVSGVDSQVWWRYIKCRKREDQPEEPRTLLYTPLSTLIHHTKMRTYCLVLTAVLLAVYSPCVESFTPCPDEVASLCPLTPGQNPLFFAHPNHCSMFCECDHGGVAWQLQCGNSLLWDDTIKTCNWPHNVDCGSRPTP
ncbi:uncharacterized protein LOC121855571 [Homarus americanus]|uniref:uncharacterized protein LOC121855571 n=1 Tax=Homarus americanus TaxID=6706 RepID=UPI001C477626|nr:uncharacterized protein LOC121855571 [Homarus americanus]